MPEVPLILLNYGLESTLNVYFVLIILMSLQKFLPWFFSLIIQMIPYRFLCSFRVNDVLCGGSFKHWCSFVLGIGVRVVIMEGVWRFVGGRAAIGSGKRFSIGFAVGLEIFLLIKVHCDYIILIWIEVLIIRFDSWPSIFLVPSFQAKS